MEWLSDKKTKFMVIKGSDEDRTKMSMEGLTIDHCDVYVYLGAVFTSNGSTKSAIEEHYKMKQSHFHKLVIFLQTNVDMPFSAKRKVVDACFNLFYTDVKVGLGSVAKWLISCTSVL